MTRTRFNDINGSVMSTYRFLNIKWLMTPDMPHSNLKLWDVRTLHLDHAKVVKSTLLVIQILSKTKSFAKQNISNFSCIYVSH